MLLAAIAASAVVASCNGGNPVPTTNAVQPSSAAQATTTTVTPTATVTPITTVAAPVVIAAAVRPVGIVSYECETLWPGHRSAHSLTFDGSQVTQVFGVEQHGVLTLAGTERLPELLAAIDPTAIAAHFEGEAPPLVVCRGFGDRGEGGSSSFDFGDDLVGGLFPDEWLGVVVPVLCPESDRFGEGIDAGEYTAL